MTVAEATVTRTDRVLGLLLGTALGDGLGAAFEGKTLVTESALRAVEQESTALTYTDDTALTVVLAEHLAAHPRVDVDALAREFAAAWSAEPWRGYGPGAATVFGLIAGGVPWRDAAGSAFGGQGSYGNGGAMRAAPVAVVARGLHHAAELGRRTAAVTHAHEHGKHGAELQAAAAHIVLCSSLESPLDVDLMLDDLARVVRSRPWHAKLERIAELVRAGVSPAHAAHALGNDVSALGSVPTALLAFLSNPEDPAAAIHYAVRAGGDTDTIAAMAGALAGARRGAAAFPQVWVDRVEVTERLRAVAHRLG